MEPENKLDRVEAELSWGQADPSFVLPHDADCGVKKVPVRSEYLVGGDPFAWASAGGGKPTETPHAIQSASEFSPPGQTGTYGAREYKVDTVWGLKGKLDLSGRLTFMREESGTLRIWESHTGITAYEGDGKGIGLRPGTDGAGATLFLDEVGLALEAAYKGVVDRDSVERLYFGSTREQKFADIAAQQSAERDAEMDHAWHLDLEGADNSIRLPRDVYGKPLPPQAYVTWDLGDPKLDPNQQLSGMKRHIIHRMGAAGLDDHAFVLECGQNFRAAIEVVPVIDDAFTSWARWTGHRGDLPPHFMLADNVKVEAGHHEPNNAMLYPRDRERMEALGRLQECTIRIVGLNVPTEAETQRAKFAKLRAEVHALRSEISVLRGTPPEPSDEETLGRAMGFGR